MHLITVAPGTALGSANSQLTKSGPGAILGTLIFNVASTTQIVEISDNPSGASPVQIISTTVPVGWYTVKLDAISRKSDWWISTTGGVRVFATVSAPKN